MLTIGVSSKRYAFLYVFSTGKLSNAAALPPSAGIIARMSATSMPTYVCSGAGRRLVVAERGHVLGAGLARNLLRDRAGEHLRPKHRRNTHLLDLIDQVGDVFCARLREVRRLDRADHRPPVLARPVRPRVVV